MGMTLRCRLLLLSEKMHPPSRTDPFTNAQVQNKLGPFVYFASEPVGTLQRYFWKHVSKSAPGALSSFHRARHVFRAFFGQICDISLQSDTLTEQLPLSIEKNFRNRYNRFVPRRLISTYTEVVGSEAINRPLHR